MKMDKVEYVACMGIMRNLYCILVGKPLERSSYGWKDVIEMEVKQIHFKSVQ
jgi:hypothetical protein